MADDATTHDPAADAGITNMFVLMLENRSFDHVFAMSGIPGLRVATTADHNSWTSPGEDRPRTVHVAGDAPWSMTTDPGHEFEDVVEQLCGVKPCCPGHRHEHGGHPDHGNGCDDADDCYPGGPYPAIKLSGFARNYATSTSEGTGTPAPEHVGDVLACFDTPRQLPVLFTLATEFAICDAWHSSLPGPTWPNRFFVHGASSAGVAQSPHTTEQVEWETVRGFAFEHGSIFDALDDAGHGWRLYQDKHNDFSDDPSPWHQGGWISQAASLRGISLLDVRDVRDLREDLARRDGEGRPAYLDVPYTFIEPNFGASFFARQGDAPGPTYRGGSAQHPEDDPSGGEGLVKAVYEAIRQSPVWESSLLVVVYDEHGGFYDSVPPGPAVPPGDRVPRSHEVLNEYGFDFSRYGVRVPAVVASPRIPRGTVDHTPYDHASVPATVERVLGLGPLTRRDAAANDLRHLLTLPEARGDCPETLPEPARPPSGDRPPRRADAAPVDRDAPLPGRSNAAGFLHVLLKAELELDGHDDRAEAAITERFRQLETMDHAVDYVRRISERLGLGDPPTG